MSTKRALELLRDIWRRGLKIQQKNEGKRRKPGFFVEEAIEREANLWYTTKDRSVKSNGQK